MRLDNYTLENPAAQPPEWQDARDWSENAAIRDVVLRIAERWPLPQYRDTMRHHGRIIHPAKVQDNGWPKLTGLTGYSGPLGEYARQGKIGTELAKLINDSLGIIPWASNISVRPSHPGGWGRGQLPEKLEWGRYALHPDGPEEARRALELGQRTVDVLYVVEMLYQPCPSNLLTLRWWDLKP